MSRTSIFMVAQATGMANINKAMETNVWASTPTKNHDFDKAFNTHTDVYILFTAYGQPREDQTFCGLAHMESTATRDLDAGFWPDSSTFFGRGFDLAWICKSTSAKIALCHPTDAPERLCVDGDTVDEKTVNAVLLEMVKDEVGGPPHLDRLKARVGLRENTLRNYFGVVKKTVARGHLVKRDHGQRIHPVKKMN